MAKAGNKTLFGAMAFLTVFIVIVLSTVVYVLVQSMNKEVAPTARKTTTTTERVASTLSDTPLTKEQKRRKVLRAMTNQHRFMKSMINSKDVNAEFAKIERGDGILNEINDAIEVREESIVPDEGVLDEAFENAEYPSKQMIFGNSYSQTGSVHVFDLVNTLGVPGSRGIFYYHTTLYNVLDTVSFEKYCETEGLKIVWDVETLLDSRPVHISYLKQTDVEDEYGEHAIADLPFENLLNSQRSTIVSDKKFACIVAYPPDDPRSKYPALTLSLQQNPHFRYRFTNALGIPRADGLFISNGIHYYGGNESIPNNPNDTNNYVKRHFNSVESYGSFLRFNGFIHADNNFFKGPNYDCTLHYASKNRPIFTELKSRIEDIVDALYEGGWYELKGVSNVLSSVVADLLGREDVAILIVNQEKEGLEEQYLLPDLNRAANNYVPVGFIFEKDKNQYHYISTEAFKIYWEKKDAFYFRFAYLPNTSQRPGTTKLNMIIKGGTISYTSNELHSSLKGKGNDLAVTLRDLISRADETDIVREWCDYMKALRLNGKFFTFEAVILP